MIKLCGFPVSNYYNKIKIALREKGIAFEEEYVALTSTSKKLALSPARKIPFLDVDGSIIAESQVIAEYLEDAYPDPALFPSAPLARAHCRELIEVLELYLELPARTLYLEAFFGGKVSHDVKDAAARELQRGAKALATLAKFSPYIAGERFTHADCAASVHLPLISIASKKILGTDALGGIEQIKPYLKMLMAEHPSVASTHAERKTAEVAMAAARESK